MVYPVPRALRYLDSRIGSLHAVRQVAVRRAKWFCSVQGVTAVPGAVVECLFMPHLVKTALSRDQSPLAQRFYATPTLPPTPTVPHQTTPPALCSCMTVISTLSQRAATMGLGALIQAWRRSCDFWTPLKRQKLLQALLSMRFASIPLPSSPRHPDWFCPQVHARFLELPRTGRTRCAWAVPAATHALARFPCSCREGPAAHR